MTLLTVLFAQKSISFFITIDARQQLFKILTIISLLLYCFTWNEAWYFGMTKLTWFGKFKAPLEFKQMRITTITRLLYNKLSNLQQKTNKSNKYFNGGTMKKIKIRATMQWHRIKLYLFISFDNNFLCAMVMIPQHLFKQMNMANCNQ